ncbi:DUF2243 domain-containing protein [Halovivax limisalsi]|uniref:DUF2243 domain-containing protein n=1 Tax=Halovivax limisalsi TaxID=1453760 RepID=UPI001FFC5A16|nr:DUF2243 domain-containing protein [Halovivax limisalsi]
MRDDSASESAVETDSGDRSEAAPANETVAEASGGDGGQPADATWLGFSERSQPLVKAGVVLGIGLGGFVDGIVLHQILQVHHMVSSRVAPTDLAGMEVNVLADGIFHAATYLFTIAGIVLLYRAWQSPSAPVSGRTLFGSVLMGFGLFNVVEGVVNHHLLALHRVWPAGPGPAIAWDVGFLLSGVLLLAGGYAIVRGDASAKPAG